MIDSAALLADLKSLLPKLEADIGNYAKDHDHIEQALQQQYKSAQEAERTAEHWVDWRAAQITQSAVAWVLACVFIRFLEDNQLIQQPVLAGPEGERLNAAKDAQTVYFREHPTHAEREYLNHQFDTLCKLPVMAALLDQSHNPLWALPVSADGAKSLLDFFQQIEPETGQLLHNFSDEHWNTRFLGDLYQDLSESVRKRYALLQTPDFVEEFILDNTLKPAMQTFGIDGLRMIDPTCGSGHFLLSGFERIFDAWCKKQPQINTRKLAQSALNAVHGIDINPYAVAIARFRLLIAAMQAADSSDIQRAPDFQFNLAVGDSLLHGKRHESVGQGIQIDSLDDTITHVLNTEDKPQLERILGQRYHVVVGNPPYITVKDKALNKAYRDKYPTCHRQYSLGVPFTERFFDLTQQEPEAGFMGMITTNSFMKREFGKKIIQEYLPQKDLTHVIDTSGAYIPGHGTPTVILYARNRKPVQDSVRAVLGIRGEPSTPDDPAQGKVWSSVVSLLDQPGSENEFVSSVDQDRELYCKHPWSVGGGGASELKAALENHSKTQLDAHVASIGFASFPGADDVFIAKRTDLIRRGHSNESVKELVIGVVVRDWIMEPTESAYAPYNDKFDPVGEDEILGESDLYWNFKTVLWGVKSFGGKTRRELGEDWWHWYRWVKHKYQIHLSITFAEVASHNHFVLDHGGKVFKQTAPVIKLPVDASEEDHLVLLGLLNSSTACFWIKQVFHNKGEGADSQGARQTGEAAFNYYQISSTGLKKFPVPELHSQHIGNRAGNINALAIQLADLSPANALQSNDLITEKLAKTENARISVWTSMVYAQEELDWVNYSLYELIDEELVFDGEDTVHISPGERAFEIILARKLKDGSSTSTWFERHTIKPITEIPTHWPADYQALVQKRIDAIENNKSIGLIEQPEYKRRWATESWEEKVADASREYLLDAIEQLANNSGNAELQTSAQLANQLQSNTRFQQVAEVYTGSNTFNLQDLITDLVNGESVPQMATARYKAKGMPKFRAWQDTWSRQRREDAGETLDIAVPPKYASRDFAKPGYWKHRGKLDVPKERFFSLPHCEKNGDTTPVIGWAGLNHLQRATAIAAWYLQRKENDGWQTEQLMPMLAALDELIPWLLQWHNDLDPEYNERMGDYYQSFLAEEIRNLGTTSSEVYNWQPPATLRRTRKKRASKSST